MTHQHICEGISSRLKAVGRDTRVQNSSGNVGKIDHLLVDTENWQIVELIVRRGIMADQLIIPMSWLACIDDQGIFIRGTHRQLSELHRYRARPDADILLELQDWFDEAPFDFGDVVPTVEDGVLRLHGVVENAAAKRHAELIGRSIRGVVDVENRLETSTDIVAQVTAALQDDERAQPVTNGSPATQE